MSNDYKKLAIGHVRSVCPELMELSFGCKVLLKPKEGENMEMVNWSIKEPVPVVSMCDGSSGVSRMEYVDNFGSVGQVGMERLKDEDGEETDEWVEVEYEDSIEKIIGHTPHLEHWLRGIEATKTYTDDDVYIDTVGMFHKENDQLMLVGADFDYNLTKDGENQDSSFYEAYCNIVGIINPN